MCLSNLKKVLFTMIVLWLSLSATVPVKAQTEIHTVESGETFTEVAWIYGVSSEQLEAANPGVDPFYIMVGDELVIPPSEAGAFETFIEEMYAGLVSFGTADCEVLIDRSAVCYLPVTNISDGIISNLQLSMTVTDSTGTQSTQAVRLPLSQFDKGEEIPVMFMFPGEFTAPLDGKAVVDGMSSSQDLSGMLRISPDNYSVETVLAPDKINADVTITFAEGAAYSSDKELNILAAAYAADGRIIGLRTKYCTFTPELSLTVYSAGAEINTINVWIESF